MGVYHLHLADASPRAVKCLVFCGCALLVPMRGAGRHITCLVQGTGQGPSKSLLHVIGIVGDRVSGCMASGED